MSIATEGKVAELERKVNEMAKDLSLLKDFVAILVDSIRPEKKITLKQVFRGTANE